MVKRVPVRPNEDYELHLEARSVTPNSGLTVKLCLKHILFSERYTPTCRQIGFTFPGGEDWQAYSANISSGSLGRLGHAYWPVTLMLHNGTRGAAIDLTNIRLIDSTGVNIVANGDFFDGGDRWFFVSDFLHLAWHTKSLPLHIYFEQGALGLAAYLLLLVAVLFQLVVAVANRNQFAGAALTSLVFFLTVGIFGTIIDHPRIAFLSYIILFMSLLLPNRPSAAPREPPVNSQIGVRDGR